MNTERGRSAWGVEMDLTEVEDEAAYEDRRKGLDEPGEDVLSLVAKVTPITRQIHRRRSRMSDAFLEDEG